MKPYIIPFEQLKNTDVALVGGKNASIGEMISSLASLGVSVPGGFATTSHAYRDFLAQARLDERIRTALASLDVDDVERLAVVGKEIRGWMLATPFPTRLNEEVLDDNAFLAQCYGNHEDRERMFFDALEKTPQGLCACVFDTTDRVQHMFWRYLDKDHPAVRDMPQDQKPRVIQDLYDRMDTLVGRVMQQIDDQTLLLVISDHGFKSFNRCMNLNAWLHQNGYLVLKDGKGESGDWFEDVDWSRTRAYTMGLNGLYMNIKGREREGIVEAGAEAEALKEELRGKLDGLVDPASGKVGITGMFDCDAVYAGPYVDNAPDLIVGYGEGFRASWDSVMGKVTTAIFEDNLKAWSGDHCVDPRLVPGVLFSNRKIAIEKPAIVDVAPTVMKLFGLELPMYFDGKPWAVAAGGGK